MGCNKDDMNPFCAHLSEDVRKRLCDSACEYRIARNQVIPVSVLGDRIAIVKQGALSMQTMHVEGSSGIMLFTAFAGDLGNITHIAGSTAKHAESFNSTGCAFAFVDSAACCIPAAVMRNLYREDPTFAFVVMSKLSDYHESVFEQLSSTNWLPVKDRIQRLMAVLRQSGIDCSRITHQQLAAALGVNRVTITKQSGVLSR